MRHVLQLLRKRNKRSLPSNSINRKVKALLIVGGLLLPVFILHVWLLAPEEFIIPPRDMTLDGASKSRYLGEARETFVINLPHRDDRRNDMDKLRTALGISWDYFDGVYLNSSLVRNILDWVHAIRSGPPYIVDDEVKPSIVDNIAFTWPKDIEGLARSSSELELWSNEHGVWPLPPAIPKELPPYIQLMASATQNYNIAVNLSAQPEYLLLTEARVACWFGHLGLIHKVANSLKEDQFAIILEDDVDMERDTDEQMKRLWPYLPDDWDVVFLGIHFYVMTPLRCFAHESKMHLYRPLLFRRIARTTDIPSPPRRVERYQRPTIFPLSIACLITAPMYPCLRSLTNGRSPAPSAFSISAIRIFSCDRPGIRLAYRKQPNKELFSCAQLDFSEESHK